MFHVSNKTDVLSTLELVGRTCILSVSATFGAMSTPVKQTHMSSPGYKSHSKLLWSANRLQVFIADKIRKENIILRSENIKLKQYLTTFLGHKDKLNVDNLKLKRHVESLELQLTILKNNLDEKEEAVNTANSKISSLEENKIINED